jgi:class III poly(R)-hydroxyalkanoic acid synthase PhaE subunit
MADQPTDFLKDYQALAQQSWDAWTRYLQQQPAAVSPFAPPGSNTRTDDFMTRSMAGAKAYADWLRSAATSGMGQGGGDWQRQMQNLFAGMGGQPFTQAFSGLDSGSAQSFFQQWQHWMQAQGGLGAMPGFTGMSGFNPMPNFGSIPDFGAMPGFGDTAAFGFTRERQLQQQALATAMREYADMAARYQSLIQQANAQGFERLQAQLAEMASTDKQVESLKGLYDLWVDAAEDCYAQIALSAEFKQVYGAMVNAQMRVRQLQQQQLEAACRELGLPTRSEVTALGKRLQELRREVRSAAAQQSSEAGDAADTLRAEVAALKRKLAEAQRKAEPSKTAVKTAKKPAPARSAAPRKTAGSKAGVRRSK